jgi:hypothetical protein
MHSKHIASLALALAAATTAGLAQAHDTRVQWAVTIGSPVLAIPLPPPPPLPVLVVRPRPEVVWVPAPVYVERPIYGHRRGWRDSDRDGIPDRYDRYDNRWDHRYDHRREGWQGR